MGFVRIFSKNNVQEAYLPKTSIWGQIDSEIVAQLYSENSIQILLIFFGVDGKKFRTVCMEFCKHNWTTISETILKEHLYIQKITRGFRSDGLIRK